MVALTGQETLYVLGRDNNDSPAAETFQTTTAAIADLAGTIGPGGTLNIAGAAGVLTLTFAETIVLVNTTFAPCSFALPAASIAGRKVTMIDMNGNAAANNITTTVNGGGLMNGSASAIVSNSNYAILVFYDNSISWNL